MKISTNWLREYTEINCSLKELAGQLTMAGMEVEETIELSCEQLRAAGGEGKYADTVFDAKVTPNRGDWLSMIGVAREISALNRTKLKMPEWKINESSELVDNYIKIRIDAPELCRRYVGVLIRGVKVGESPGWMKDRLIAAGMRPINNVVDITNYVMLEMGQPLHAFDYSLLKGQQIIVRRAVPGETITTIDDAVRELTSETLVIADADRPVAVAGVMGGADSEINENTEDILLESANFNSVSVRQTSKRLNLVTESSYRFERQVDPSITVNAALKAAYLMQELCGGKVASGVVDVYPCPVQPLQIEARPERVNMMLGTNIDCNSMAEYLNALCIDTECRNGKLICSVPTFRADITHEIDLVEEVGRMYGYEKLDMTLPDSSMQGKDSPEGIFRDKVRRILISCGGQEALTHSLVEDKLINITGMQESCLKIRNPLNEELSSMRVLLVPSLLQVIGRNQAYGTSDVSVFEIGKVYFRTSKGEIGEKLSIGWAMVGNIWRNGWNLPVKSLEADFYTCKGVLESLLDELGIGNAAYVETRDPVLHPTRAAKVLVDGKEIGMLGEASPEAIEAFEVRGRACLFELDFESLMSVAPNVLKYKQLPRYPALHRHLSVVVDKSIPYADVASVILNSGAGLVEDVDLLDVYEGEQIEGTKRSITVSMVFRSHERTLKDEEVNTVLAGITESLSQKLSANFR